MLRYFIQKVHRRRHLAKPRLVVAVPSGITGVEQSAVKEAGHQAGARRVYVIEEPMAAAIGAGLPVYEPVGNMVVDVGGGTTEVAVISLGGIVTSDSIRAGGDKMDHAIIAFAKKEYSLMLGERTAEEIKMAIGSACPSPQEPHAEIRGRDLVSGLPKTVVISGGEVRHAIAEPVSAVVDIVKSTLDKCPPELAGDVMDRGIALTGGGALLRGLDERLGEEEGFRSTWPTIRWSRSCSAGQMRRGLRRSPAGAGTGEAPVAVERGVRAPGRVPLGWRILVMAARAAPPAAQRRSPADQSRWTSPKAYPGRCSSTASR